MTPGQGPTEGGPPVASRPTGPFPALEDAELGWIGLGVMGSRLTERLLQSGYSVSGWNRTSARARPLVERGLTLLETPRDVAARCDVIFLMVTDAAAVEDVIAGEHGVLSGLRPGTVLLEMSTIDPEVSRRLAARVGEAGGYMLDCPISGGVHAAEKGEVTVMVGGDLAAFEHVKPLFDVFAKKSVHVGTHGQALLTKIAINVSLCIQMIGLSEGIILAEKAGLKREKVVEVMLDSAIASPMLKQRAPAVLPGGLPDPPWFDCRMMGKDLDLALSLARKLEIPMLASSLADELMTACRGSGLGHEDFSVVFHLLARVSGLSSDAEDRPA